MPKVDPAECLFCKISKGEIPAKKVHEDDRYIAFEDINPQAPTHLLIIPRTHIESLDAMGPEHAELVGGMFLLAGRLARERGIAEAGYRTVFNCNEGAGQSVWHLHLHVLGGRSLTWPPG